MRRVLPLIAVLLMGFAPVPFPKATPPRKKTVLVVLRLKRLDVTVVAAYVKKTLGSRSGVAVVYDVASNTLFLKGPKQVIDKVIPTINSGDDVSCR